MMDIFIFLATLVIGAVLGLVLFGGWLGAVVGVVVSYILLALVCIIINKLFIR